VGEIIFDDEIPAGMKSASTADGWISFHLRSRFHPNSVRISSRLRDFIENRRTLPHCGTRNFTAPKEQLHSKSLPLDIPF